MSVLSEVSIHKIPTKTQSFYWTRKSISQIVDIYSEYLDDGMCIYDPFLGSGAALYAASYSGKEVKFIGSEINEMPISSINFTLDKNYKKNIERIASELTTFENKYKSLYVYEIDSAEEPLYFLSATIDIDGNTIRPISFSVLNSKNEVITLSHEKNTAMFSQVMTEYLKRNEHLKEIKTNDYELVKNSRIAIKDDMKISDLFSPVNFHLLNEFKNRYSKQSINIILSSILHLCKYTDLKMQSQFPYWFPKKNCLDRNILELIKSKLKKFSNSNFYDGQNKYLIKCTNFESLMKNKNSYLLLNKPVQKITNTDIPDESVDFVITDPPYFDQVAFSEYLEIWKYFTGYKNNIVDEIVISNRMNSKKDEENYISELKNAFKIVYRKMKDKSLLVLYFKDSNPSHLYQIFKIFEEINMMFIAQKHIKKNKYTYKQNTTKKSTVEGDCIFIFEKNKMSKKNYNKEIKRQESLEKFLINYVTDIVNKEPKSLSELYDEGLIYELYKNGYLKHIRNVKIIVNILNSKFVFNPHTRQYE